MNAIITFLAIVLGIMIIVLVPPLSTPYLSGFGPVEPITAGACAKAVLFCFILALLTALVIRREKNHGPYLLRLFLLALLVRVLIGTAIFVFNGQEFFGGDAWTYDFFGYLQKLAWAGDKFAAAAVDQFTGKGVSSGWGMVYLVAAIYEVVDRNMLAVQFFNAVLGAATAVIIFLCALEVFNNRRVANIAGLAVGFYPSLVLWSSQGLKDGAIVFSLALAILSTLKLGRKLSWTYMIMLIAALFFVLALRFYVFYMLLAAVGGAFLVGMRAVTARSLARQVVVVFALGVSLTYLGVTRYANLEYERFGSLAVVQRSRADLARSNSGFNQDVDVSTTSGALSTIPLGVLYLLFAPFPWQLGSLRQSLTLPEMLIWWASFPMLIMGLWFSIRYRWRQLSPILIFTSMLTVAYSVFQGNVGTAYRQRAQLLVFYFIFVAVGFVLVQEKREERARRGEAEKLASRRRPTWGRRDPKSHVAGAPLKG
jgi:hypothetical protein